MCQSTVYIIGKASGQQQAISSYVLEKSKVTQVIEPMSIALAGEFLTTGVPGKSRTGDFLKNDLF